MDKKILTILVVILAFIVVILTTMVFNQDGLNNSTTTSSSTTTRTTTTTTRKKINAYNEIYEWLLKHGEPNNTHTQIVYAQYYGDTLVNIIYSTAFEGSIKFNMYYPDHNGSTLTLSYNISKNDSNTVGYSVELRSNESDAYSKNSYQLNKSTFIKNSPVTSKGFISSYNIDRFPTPYTDEEKEQGCQLKEEVDQIHYDCLLTFLDYLENDFCVRVGLCIQDLGYLKY